MAGVSAECSEGAMRAYAIAVTLSPVGPNWAHFEPRGAHVLSPVGLNAADAQIGPCVWIVPNRALSGRRFGAHLFTANPFVDCTTVSYCLAGLETLNQRASRVESVVSKALAPIV